MGHPARVQRHGARPDRGPGAGARGGEERERKRTRVNSSHGYISGPVFHLRTNRHGHHNLLALVVILGESLRRPRRHLLFFFNDAATTEIYTLALHDALPI